MMLRGRLSFRAVAVSGVLLALGGATWMSVGRLGIWPRLVDPHGRPALRELVDANGTSRRIEGRLTGGFAWGPAPRAVRGRDGDREGAITSGLQIAASRLLERATPGGSPSELADEATALLLLGRYDDGVDALEESVESAADVSAHWSDLAAAYLARFDHAGPATDLPRALDAVERSLALDRSPEAMFNRALILERLNLTSAAAAAWTDYLAADAASGWAAETREHFRGTQEQLQLAKTSARSQTTRETVVDEVLWRWAVSEDRGERERLLAEAERESHDLAGSSSDQLIADIISSIKRADTMPAASRSAHAAYGAGRAAYRKDAFADADPHFALAERAASESGSPLALLARIHRAIIRYRLNDLEAATAQLVALTKDPSLTAYPSIRGRALWILGQLAVIRGEQAEAVGNYRHAMQAFAEADERPNVAFVEMLSAFQLEELGDIERAWRARVSAFAQTDREGPVLVAARSASMAGWPHAAGALYEIVATMSRERQRDTILADAVRGRARALAAAGQYDAALSTLAEATRLASAHPEPAWDTLRAEIRLAEAECSIRKLPGEAVVAATDALSHFAAHKMEARFPEALLVRARAHRAAGDTRAAESDLSLGIDALERVRDQLGEWRLRAVLGDVAQRFGDELVTLRIDEGRTDDALDAAERLRAWGSQSTPHRKESTLALHELAKGMTDDTLLAWFFVGVDETYLWRLRRDDGIKFARIPIGRQKLARLVQSDPSRNIGVAAELRRLLFASIEPELRRARRLVIVPDGALYLLAFAALPGASKPYLIEEHTVLLAPSAAAFLTALKEPSKHGFFDSALVVGNPTLDRSAAESLRDLPQSNREAAAVSALYSNPTVLTGRAATRGAILDGLPRHGVFHFAGHSLANPFAPGESQLVVAGPAARITASEISRLSLHGVRIVMLSSCDSVMGPPTRSEGPLGLAVAFLSAGAGAVVATLTPVSDYAARELSTRFHRELGVTADAAQALQRAQQSLLYSSDPMLSTPDHWAAFVVVGTN